MKNWIKVLSLFDWIACWYEALLRAWIKIEEYFASEIDKYAMQIAIKNHPDIVQLWDVREIEGGGRLKNIDLLIWWSPCQWFSVAGKQLAFEDPRSKLFFEYVRILNEVKPKYFLLENVRMKQERVDIISWYLWVQPIEINSSLVSAQNRRRLYRTNIPWISQPKDRWILLKDILEKNVDEKYYYNEKKIQDLVSFVDWELRIKQATKKWYIVAKQWDWINLDYPTSKTRRWRVIDQKSNTLTTHGENCVYDKVIRKLTPVECERLQTLPDWYTEWVSDSQRYKMLWNGRTVEVIAYIFKNLDQ